MTTLDNRNQVMAALVEDYVQHCELHGTGESRIALAHSRKDVHALNQYIRMARIAGGELAHEIRVRTAHGDRDFAVGDRVLFTQNDQSTIRNGLLGTVQQINDQRITVKMDDRSAPDDMVQIDHRNFKAFDQGYAATIHKSQGVTVDQAFVLSSRGMDKHLTYVAMTRHRQGVHLYKTQDFGRSRPATFEAFRRNKLYRRSFR